MKTKVLEDADVVTYVVVCDPGDEAFSSLVEFARPQRTCARCCGPTSGSRSSTSTRPRRNPRNPGGALPPPSADRCIAREV